MTLRHDPFPLTPEAWEAAARERLGRDVYDYYAGGAGDEVTVRANRAAWAELFLRPRVLVDVSEVDTVGHAPRNDPPASGDACAYCLPASCPCGR